MERTKGLSREEIERDENLNGVLAECLNQLKSNTRHYARKQTTWIKNRLSSMIRASVYCVDATDLALWDSNVAIPAIEICKGKLQNKFCRLSFCVA